MVYSKNIEQVQFIAVLGLDFAQFLFVGRVATIVTAVNRCFRRSHRNSIGF